MAHTIGRNEETVGKSRVIKTSVILKERKKDPFSHEASMKKAPIKGSPRSGS